MTTLRANDGDDRATEIRKSQHLAIARTSAVEPSLPGPGPFDGIRLPHEALPEVDLDAVDPTTTLLGKRLVSPLLIGSMTGGTAEARTINQRLAEVAQAHGIGMGVGSQRAMVERPSLAYTFDVRSVAPDILLVANIGAVQLRRGVSPRQVEDAALCIGADAVVFHLNPAQEAVQPEGDTCFAGLADAIGDAVESIGLPCGVKEVGCGFSRRSVERLAGLHLAFLESAGAGGTSWPLIEGLRSTDPVSARLGSTFARWGIDSMESLANCVDYGRGIPVIASGGVRTGLDAARAIAAGATAVAMALPFLRAASDGPAACELEVRCFERELRTAMFLVGATDVAQLRTNAEAAGWRA